MTQVAPLAARFPTPVEHERRAAIAANRHAEEHLREWDPRGVSRRAETVLGDQQAPAGRRAHHQEDRYAVSDSPEVICEPEESEARRTCVSVCMSTFLVTGELHRSRLDEAADRGSISPLHPTDAGRCRRGPPLELRWQDAVMCPSEQQPRSALCGVCRIQAGSHGTGEQGYRRARHSVPCDGAGNIWYKLHDAATRRKGEVTEETRAGRAKTDNCIAYQRLSRADSSPRHVAAQREQPRCVRPRTPSEPAAARRASAHPLGSSSFRATGFGRRAVRARPLDASWPLLPRKVGTAG